MFLYQPTLSRQSIVLAMKILISWVTFGLVTTVLMSSSIITITQSFYLHVSNAMEMDSHSYNISDITDNDSLLNTSNTVLLSNVSFVNADNTSNYANTTDSNSNLNSN